MAESTTPLTPDAKLAIQQYMKDLRKEARAGRWVTRVAWIVTNVAVVIVGWNSAIGVVKDVATEAASSELKEDIERAQASMKERIAQVETELDRDVRSLRTRVDDAIEATGVERRRVEGMASTLNAAFEGLSSRSSELAPVIEAQEAQVADLARQVATILRAATSLEGEEGEQRLVRLANLAESMKDGKALDALAELASTVQALRVRLSLAESQMALGRFSELRCDRLFIGPGEGAPQIVLGTSKETATVQIINKEGKVGAELTLSSDGGGAMYANRPSGEAAAYCGASVGGGNFVIATKTGRKMFEAAVGNGVPYVQLWPARGPADTPEWAGLTMGLAADGSGLVVVSRPKDGRVLSRLSSTRDHQGGLLDVFHYVGSLVRVKQFHAGP